MGSSSVELMKEIENILGTNTENDQEVSLTSRTNHETTETDPIFKKFSEAFKKLMADESKRDEINAQRFSYLCKAHEKKFYRIAKFLFIYQFGDELDSVKVESMLKSMDAYFELYIEDDAGRKKRNLAGRWKDALLLVAELSIIDKFSDCLVQFLNIMKKITDDEMHIYKQQQEIDQGASNEMLDRAASHVHPALKIVIDKSVKDPLIFQDIINETNDRQRTALHYACKYGIKEAVFLLLELGADLLKKDKSGEPPLSKLPDYIMEEYLNTKMVKEPRKTVVYNHDFLKRRKREEIGLDFPEIRLLHKMGSIPKLRKLLLHPVLLSLLMRKWGKYRWVFAAKLFIHLFTSLYLTYYCIYVSNLSDTVKYSHQIVLEILFIVLLIVEVLECISHPKSYVCKLSTYLNLSLVGVGGYFVIQDCGTSFSITPKSETASFCPHASALSILLTWITFLMFLGNHKICSKQISIFKIVVQNFFQFLIAYAVIIFAFALSFYILFHDCPNGCPDGSPFDDIGDSIFKTLIMLTGEFDASNIPFSTENVTSQVIFIGFVLLIAIVLLNLLNGLAVHETSVIIEDAILNANVAIIDYLTSVECVLLKAAKYECLRNFLKKRGFFDNYVPTKSSSNNGVFKDLLKKLVDVANLDLVNETCMNLQKINEDKRNNFVDKLSSIEEQNSKILLLLSKTEARLDEMENKLTHLVTN